MRQSIRGKGIRTYPSPGAIILMGEEVGWSRRVWQHVNEVETKGGIRFWGPTGLWPRRERIYSRCSYHQNSVESENCRGPSGAISCHHVSNTLLWYIPSTGIRRGLSGIYIYVYPFKNERESKNAFYIHNIHMRTSINIYIYIQNILLEEFFD